MKNLLIDDTFNGVKILQESTTGKFGLQEIIDDAEQEPEFRYSTLHLAAKIALQISNENDRLGKSQINKMFQPKG